MGKDKKNSFKEINIGKLIAEKWKESKIDISRASSFMGCDAEQIEKYFLEESLQSQVILKWSKLLEYDFFRLYSSHLILYATPKRNSSIRSKIDLPEFRKNIYTKELIEFIIELIETREKTKLQVIEEYRIPRTTLYRWLNKYRDPNYKKHMQI